MSRTPDPFELPNTQPWMGQALCQGSLESDLFFPPSDGHQSRTQIAAARAYCRHCPVVQPCFEYAMEHNLYGIWGGSTDRDRRRIKGQNSKQQAAIYRAALKAQVEA